MHVGVAIVTMVTMNICRETNVLMGLRFRKYIESRLQLHTVGEV